MGLGRVGFAIYYKNMLNICHHLPIIRQHNKYKYHPSNNNVNVGEIQMDGH